MWVDAPQVGNFNDQKWGISVIAVTSRGLKSGSHLTSSRSRDVTPPELRRQSCAARSTGRHSNDGDSQSR